MLNRRVNYDSIKSNNNNSFGRCVQKNAILCRKKISGVEAFAQMLFAFCNF